MKQISLNLDCETTVQFEPTQGQSSLCLEDAAVADGQLYST